MEAKAVHNILSFCIGAYRDFAGCRVAGSLVSADSEFFPPGNLVVSSSQDDNNANNVTPGYARLAVLSA